MTSLRPSLRPLVVGVLAGLGLGIAALLVSWRLVRDDARRAEAAGVLKRGPYAFVGGMTALAIGLGFHLGRRLGRGRVTTAQGWVLTMGRVVPETAGYRDATPPSLGQLVERLAIHGYRLEVQQLGADGPTGAAADPRASLVGGGFWLRDAGLGPADTGVELRIASDAERRDGALGTIRAIDGGHREANAELARFAMVELGALVPALHYRADDTRLSSDAVELLRAALPERPRRR